MSIVVEYNIISESSHCRVKFEIQVGVMERIPLKPANDYIRENSVRRTIPVPGAKPLCFVKCTPKMNI